MLRYAKEDRWNNNSAYQAGFNDDAQSVIDEVAKGNYGLASDIAKTVQKYNYNISEKQAYHIAKAAVEIKVDMLYKSDGKLKIIFEK